MLTGRATAEATAAFAARGPRAADFYEALPLDADGGALTVSSLGLGTYLGDLGEARDQGYTAALEAALARGVNVLDTAINYRAQASERLIGRLLTRLVEAGTLRREEVLVCTKGGFNPRDRDDPDRGGEALLAGIPEEEVVQGMHCLHPRYIERVLARSRENLRLETIDVYYLHNPETQVPHVAKPVFYERLRRAFAVLEAARKRGELACYGTATWSGYRVAPGEAGALDLERVLGVARSVAGAEHGLRCVQLPVSLALPEGVTTPTQKVDEALLPAVEAARRLGLAVFGSGSLAQADLLRDGLPTASAALDPQGALTPAQRALHFARSSGVHVALVGVSDPAHVEEDLAVADRPRAPREVVLQAAGGAS